MKKLKYILITGFIFLTFVSCKNSKGGGVKGFLFPVENDVKLGKQLSDHIAANPSEYPVLPRSKNLELYQKIEGITNDILKSNQIRYKDEFAWEVKVIKQDVLNAFAAPGGYIYVYTGILEYLDSEDHFAGVMGHEIAHADRRHSVNQQIKNGGVQLLLAIVAGQNQISQIAGQLIALRHSRSDESDADAWSVKYLCTTEYKSNGAAGFFRKIESESNGSRQPEFLSTHPSPDKRVQKIDDRAKKANCSGNSAGTDWSRIQELSRSSSL